MKGDRAVITELNDVLSAELTAINQYFIHAEICKNWGYEKLHKQFRKVSIDVMIHAEDLIDRILFLEGQPNMSKYLKVNVGNNAEKQLTNDLSLQYEIIQRLREGINACYSARDTVSRELLQKILRDQESWIKWTEAQLEIIAEIGLEKYLAEHV